MDQEVTYYLAGPMTGYPQFNFPLFLGVAKKLRSAGLDVISPAEMDSDATKKAVMKSEDGKEGTTPETWGAMLGRDIQVIADKCGGIVFLPNWQDSKGARLEATCAVNLGYICWEIDVENSDIIERSHGYVMDQVRFNSVIYPNL